MLAVQTAPPSLASVFARLASDMTGWLLGKKGTSTHLQNVDAQPSPTAAVSMAATSHRAARQCILLLVPALSPKLPVEPPCYNGTPAAVQQVGVVAAAAKDTPHGTCTSTPVTVNCCRHVPCCVRCRLCVGLACAMRATHHSLAA